MALRATKRRILLNQTFVFRDIRIEYTKKNKIIITNSCDALTAVVEILSNAITRGRNAKS